MGPGSVRNLEIWRLSIDLARRVYDVTCRWPRAEYYGLTMQIRRAAVSVPANIAEGVGRGRPGEVARFSHIALGSLYELDTLFEVAEQVGLSTGELRSKLPELIRKTSAFLQHQRTRLRRDQQATGHKPQARAERP